MTMYVVIMEGFVDVSTAHYDKDSNNSLSYQNLTKFDTVNQCQQYEKLNIRDETFFILYA